MAMRTPSLQNDSLVGINREIGSQFDDVKTVAENIESVVTVAGHIDNVDTVATNIVDVHAVGGSIVDVRTVATNINNVVTVGQDIANVNTVAANVGNIDMIVTEVLPNINEIANASANAAIATTKANEAATSAANALVSEQNAKASELAAGVSENNAATSEAVAIAKATEASASAVTATTQANLATTKASEAAASAATATTKAAEASASATSASTSANNASASETNSALSEANALSYKNSASDSADTATTQAGIATTKAGEASASATSATNSATTATNQATIATTKATEASASATSATNSATTATNQATIATTKAGEASASATSASNSATTATTKANEASASATSASNSATTATTKANEASDSATIATSQALTATTKASDASASATAARNSELAAAAMLDAFDDRYLGSFTVDPTTDNDGQPLLDGALYFNTSENALKVYDVGTTTWYTIPQTLLSSLLDVQLTSVATGDILNWNGTKWVNTSSVREHIADTSNPHSVTKAQVGLGNVDNTADVDKNVLSATKWATSRLITLGGDATGSVSIDGNSDVTLTVNVVDDSHNHAFGNLTGKPTTVAGYGITDVYTKTQTDSNISTAVAGLVNGSPAALDTLNELAAALGNDANFATTVSTSIGTKVTKNADIVAGTNTKIAYDAKGLVTGGTSLAATDIPALDWSKITTGKPTTLSGYGISDATPSSHIGTTGASHGVATTSVNGFMSSADKTKLDGIATNANNYVHPTSGVVAGTYTKITVDSNGHATAGSTPTTLAEYSIGDAYTKTESDSVLALKTNKSDTDSVNMLRADKFLAAQNIANMIYTSGDLTKIRYNNDTDVNYEVLNYVSGNLSSINHYTGGVLRGTTTLSYTNGNLVSAVFA